MSPTNVNCSIQQQQEICSPSLACRALGVDEEMAHTSIRFGLGRFSTAQEVEVAIQQTVDRVAKLREMSPLWDMVQDGIDLKTIQWTQH